MCGICGIIELNGRKTEEKNLRLMMKTMKHRGPDDEGIFQEGNVGLGFVRLSIIDLSPAGHQPMFSDCGQYVLVYNGEIYNYIELREELQVKGYTFRTKTDSEVLLKSYLEWGEECLHRFNGMWAFVIYNRNEKTIFAARDRFGIKPFYYLQNQDFFAFASEIPPLLTLLQVKPQPDYQSIFDYLVFNRTDQTERTFFSEVKKLQHGHILLMDLNQHSRVGILVGRQWYNLKERVLKSEGFKNPQEYKELFTSAIGLRLRSDVPVGVCLSGGLDSSSIVSILLHDFKKSDLNTFSAVYKKGQKGDETEYINEFNSSLTKMFFASPDAGSLEKDLIQFVKAHGEPISSTSPYAQYIVMKLAQGEVVVTLDGQGADEQLAGYHYFFGFFFKDLLTHGQLNRLISEMFHYLAKHNSLMGIKSFLFFMMPHRIRTKLKINEKGYLNPVFAKTFSNTSSIGYNLYGSKTLTDALLDHFEYKLEHLLKWEDRNSMWFSLEARVPFLDYRLVEKTIATSNALKIWKGTTKHILREAMKGILPDKIYNRQDKVGFGTPQDEWFREQALQKIICECIESDTFKNRKLIDPQAVKELYKKHLSGDVNISSEIWKWVHLELWFREFID
jgi:asparagine synthase (glutamine-hydrolysing)